MTPTETWHVLQALFRRPRPAVFWLPGRIDRVDRVTELKSQEAFRQVHYVTPPPDSRKLSVVVERIVEIRLWPDVEVVSENEA